MTDEVVDITRAEKRRSMAEENKAMHEQIESLKKQLMGTKHLLGKITQERNLAISERDQMLGAITKFLPAGLAIDGNMLKNNPEWKNFVAIDMPLGQGFWHFHQSNLPLFKHLKPYTTAFDGHDFATKYNRLNSIRPKGSIITL